MAHAIIICGQSLPFASGRASGAYIVANIFRKYGISAIVLDRFLNLSHEFRDALINKFVDSDTRFICVSTTLMDINSDAPVNEMSDIDPQLTPYLDKCKQLAAPSAITMVGGSRITSKEPISYPYDYAVVGQGEQTILAIVNHVLYNDFLEFTETSGTRYVTDKTYGYSEYNSNTYLRLTDQDAVSENEVLPLEFARGCVFKCSYCNYPLIGKSFSDFTRSKESLIDDFRYNWEKLGINKYVLIDDTCNDSIEKAQRWHDAVIESGVDVQFCGYMRLELFHKYPEMAKLYLAAGLKYVIFGIESFNKEAGATMGKGFGEKAKDVLLFLKEQWGENVFIQSNFIIGLPHDTYEHLDSQFEWLATSKTIHKASFIPLFISDKSDSILAREYQTYYKNLGTERKRGSINWVSPIMSRSEAIELSRKYKLRWNKFNQSQAYISGGFQTMVLMQYYTFEELKTTVFSLEDRHRILRNRNQGYARKMLNKIKNPVHQLPSRFTPQILPGGVFESREVQRIIKLKTLS